LHGFNLTIVSFINYLRKLPISRLSTELRELKRELDEKQQLEKALQDREYESVKTELERTRSRVATLEGKVPESHRTPLPEAPKETAADQQADSSNPVQVII